MAQGCPEKNQDDLIGLIYDAILCPQMWQTFLNQLVARFGSRSGNLILQHRQTLAVGSFLQSGLDDDLDLYSREYHQHDAWILGVSQKPRGAFYSGEACVAQSDLKRTVFYNEFCQSARIEHVVGGLIPTEGPWEILLGIHRTPAQGEFNEAEVAWLNRFVPHLRRALHLSRVMDSAQHNLQASVDRLPAPCILLNRQRKIIAINERARLLVDNHPGLTLTQERLVVKMSDVARRLDALICDSFQTLSTSQGRGGGLLKLPVPGEAPLVLSVIPFRRGSHVWYQGDGDTVAILFYDQDRPMVPSGDLLQSMYGLTTAEIRVAILVAQGRRVTEIAHALKISIDGVKYHLKSIFGKTGSNRQSELVSLLLSHAVELPRPGNAEKLV